MMSPRALRQSGAPTPGDGGGQRFDRDDLHDWLVMLSELAVVGLGAWAAWCAYKKAKCEACAASWELAKRVATDGDETGTEDQEETG